MAVKLTKTARAEVTFGYSVTAGELKEFFDLVPINAKITVSHWKGDQRDPEQTTLTATWTLT